MAATFNLEELKKQNLDFSKPFKHKAQVNGDTNELEAMVENPAELAEVHRANDAAVRVKHTLRFKGWQAKYLTTFRYHGCAWDKALDQITLNDIKLLAYIESHCMFGYNWIVFHGGKARDSINKDKSTISASLKALVKAGILLEEPKDSLDPDVLEMADYDLEDAAYLQRCKQTFTLITGTVWTQHHRIFRLNYRIAWYGRLMWLMRSPSNNFTSTFKGRSPQFIAAYNLYGTLPGLLFGLQESAGIQAWDAYFEMLKEASQNGEARPEVMYEK